MHTLLLPPPSDRDQGFTAIELMVTLAILAVLAALAAPSFTPIIEKWRVRDAAENLATTLYFARSEAIKLGGNIIVARNLSDSGCTSSGNTDWSCGWRVFYDSNNNGSQDTCNTANTPNECDLKISSPSPKVNITLTGSTGIIAINRWGMLANAVSATNPSSMDFLLTPQGQSSAAVSAIRLCAGTGGRITQKKGSDAC
ncbi:type IV fimbrial biogenesis protein FimT [Acidovorax sp. 99]|uniref:GspH/FimT family pseudopilin n=1 Tax=Acidovorax sp. 99 TaxID=2135634 RepID=UPI000D5CEFC0|nr:GspH/FimT family pseudopilin [Acidovorax sp. 99]PVY89773.1 type IV fimbrial biogenesis protein FimT [Acidovorax sp. 99]